MSVFIFTNTISEASTVQCDGAVTNTLCRNADQVQHQETQYKVRTSMFFSCCAAALPVQCTATWRLAVGLVPRSARGARGSSDAGMSRRLKLSMCGEKLQVAYPAVNYWARNIPCRLQSRSPRPSRWALTRRNPVMCRATIFVCICVNHQPLYTQQRLCTLRIR